MAKPVVKCHFVLGAVYDHPGVAVPHRVVHYD